MSSHDTEKEAIEAAVLTDIDGNPITCDKNPAHFDGFLTEVAAYIGRTGKWLPLVEQGVSIRGHRTVVDSPAAVPFVQGSIAGARVYSPDDPCPPTAARVADHKAAAAGRAKSRNRSCYELRSSSTCSDNAVPLVWRVSRSRVVLAWCPPSACKSPT